MGLPQGLVTGCKAKLPSLTAHGDVSRAVHHGMNRTEARYADHLDSDPNVVWWMFEPLSLRLAEGTFYRPDFAVLFADGRLEFHEVKGFWRDDARVKIKVAASLFPVPFIAVQWMDSEWVREEF